MISKFLLPVLLTLILFSCGEGVYLESRSGAWKITKVEQAFFASENAASADSSYVFESDTLGYFSFFYCDPEGIVYTMINFQSIFLTKTREATYYIDPKNHNQITFEFEGSFGTTTVTYDVKNPGSNRQQFSSITPYGTKFVRETIWIKKI